MVAWENLPFPSSWNCHPALAHMRQAGQGALDLEHGDPVCTQSRLAIVCRHTPLRALPYLTFPGLQ